MSDVIFQVIVWAVVFIALVKLYPIVMKMWKK
ncbi:hypothetical protein SAMN05443094_10363 [Domibacillus enclensis]|uniref:Uncharacterized protein n=1 Tax=Domibacillus enclensis TaxID=1017273 RepID=A0A1N6TSQ1_9BACI|nr:hypothetical protein SAMN05443094_10363 [Domibacillus enclensis]